MGSKSQPLWDFNTPTEVRLPNTTPTNVLKTSSDKVTKDNPPTEEKQVKSKLSADAAEWYPPNYRSTTAAPGSVQDRLKKHKVTENEIADDDQFVDSPDDIRLKHLVTTLTKDPGQFADLLDIFMDTLYPYFEDVIVLSRAAQLLVGQAIQYPSFRYTAARLCSYIEEQCPKFRAELHLTCKKELAQNSNKCGLLLFVAELYMQLHHDNIYADYLIDAFKHLLNYGGNDNVKSICQALKLTGHSLEMHNKKALDDVFVKLLTTRPTISGTALNLIDSVINLRGSQWGHNSPINNTNTQPEPENYFWDNVENTVFYNTDGVQFSNEESEFLAANMCSTEEYLTDTSDPDELCDPEPEMDEEIQAAFKDFVKLNKR